jgi:hypothetical protein
MSKNTLLTNILLALAVAVIGFMLLNLTFLFFAVITWLRFSEQTGHPFGVN